MTAEMFDQLKQLAAKQDPTSQRNNVAFLASAVIALKDDLTRLSRFIDRHILEEQRQSKTELAATMIAGGNRAGKRDRLDEELDRITAKPIRAIVERYKKHILVRACCDTASTITDLMRDHGGNWDVVHAVVAVEELCAAGLLQVHSIGGQHGRTYRRPETVQQFNQDRAAVETERVRSETIQNLHRQIAERDAVIRDLRRKLTSASVKLQTANAELARKEFAIQQHERAIEVRDNAIKELSAQLATDASQEIA